MGSVSDVISIIRLTATLDCEKGRGENGEKGRGENGEPFLTILVRFAEKGEGSNQQHIIIVLYSPFLT